MVREVRPSLPLLPLELELSSPPPQAATPSARAVTRQPEAARDRARKFPSSRKAIPNESANLSKRGDVAQRTDRLADVSCRDCPAGRAPRSAPSRPRAPAGG